MPRRSLDLTLEFLARIDAAPDELAVCRELLTIAGDYGFEQLLAGSIPLPGVPEAAHHGHVIMELWPPGWTERYFNHGYLRDDPAIQRVVASDIPFQWSELEAMYRDDPTGRRIMNEAADFGLRDGFTVPMHPIEGGVIGFSLAGPKLELPPGAKPMLNMLSNFAMARALLIQDKKPAPRLTQREIDILRWLAEGKTAWEIGRIFNTAENTVNNQLRLLREKFGATRNTQMLALAFRHRIIT